MKRLLFFVSVVLACTTFCISLSDVVGANVQDFVISDFQADYYLGRDDEGRSTLKTIETITALFPEYDQNHGIERALPRSYDSHTVRLNVESVTDGDYNAQPYSQYLSNDNLVVRIGDADEYVHGQITYIITYTQHDVTRFFSDTNNDEFYWDVNGVGWSQPFNRVKATVHLDQNLSDSLSGDKSCYFGFQGSSDLCKIFLDKDNNQVTAFTVDLSAGQNMTIAIGFKPHTFEPYKMTPVELFLKRISIPLGIFCYVVLAIILLVKLLFYRHASRKKSVVAQYEPPKDVDLSTSAAILHRSGKIFQTAIINMAIKSIIKITEGKMDIGLGITRKKYNIQLESTSGMAVSDREVAMMLFGSELKTGPGTSVDFPKVDENLSIRARKYTLSVRRDLREDGYLAKKTPTLVIIIILSLLLMVLSIFAGGLLSSSYELFANVIYLNLLICPIIIITTVAKRPMNSKGRELYDYLMGLKLFIKTVEEDRIKMLQSPEGAGKVAVDITDKNAVIRLYERLLPYAVLFGLEKDWAKVLSVYYSEQNISPAWYAGVGSFNASSFGSSLSSFSNSVGASSSSGGSSGGGSSGGGGGGGGGGGW